MPCSQNTHRIFDGLLKLMPHKQFSRGSTSFKVLSGKSLGMLVRMGAYEMKQMNWYGIGVVAAHINLKRKKHVSDGDATDAVEEMSSQQKFKVITFYVIIDQLKSALQKRIPWCCRGLVF